MTGVQTCALPISGWCQQHDEKTYEARPGRTFELASICPQDTTEIVRFLMRVEKPNADLVRAVDAAGNPGTAMLVVSYTGSGGTGGTLVDVSTVGSVVSGGTAYSHASRESRRSQPVRVPCSSSS